MTYENVKRSRKKRKQLLIDCLGGKCARCGYNTCIEALDFHHIDPNSKDFTIGQKWSNIDKCCDEAQKCVLLCANCHREFHGGIWVLSEIDIPEFDMSIIEEYLTPNRKYSMNCPFCKEDFKTSNNRKKYCTNRCKRMASRKVERPTREVLAAQVEELGYVGAGRLYGVTDNAVRKWLK